VQDPVWIEERDTVLLHQRSLILHGGAPGVLHAALLKSALARARQHYGYASGMDIITLAGVYAAGIVRNHPFVDGNQRTGFIVGVLFLELNGYLFKASEEDAAQAVLALAAGEIDEGGFIQFLRANVARGRK
jgi:death-on-curing protein